MYLIIPYRLFLPFIFSSLPLNRYKFSVSTTSCGVTQLNDMCMKQTSFLLFRTQHLLVSFPCLLVLVLGETTKNWTLSSSPCHSCFYKTTITSPVVSSPQQLNCSLYGRCYTLIVLAEQKKQNMHLVFVLWPYLPWMFFLFPNNLLALQTLCSRLPAPRHSSNSELTCLLKDI